MIGIPSKSQPIEVRKTLKVDTRDKNQVTHRSMSNGTRRRARATWSAVVDEVDAGGGSSASMGAHTGSDDGRRGGRRKSLMGDGECDSEANVARRLTGAGVVAAVEAAAAYGDPSKRTSDVGATTADRAAVGNDCGDGGTSTRRRRGGRAGGRRRTLPLGSLSMLAIAAAAAVLSPLSPPTASAQTDVDRVCACAPIVFDFKLDFSKACPPLPPPFPPNDTFGSGVKDYTCAINADQAQGGSGNAMPLILYRGGVKSRNGDERVESGRNRGEPVLRRLLDAASTSSEGASRTPYRYLQDDPPMANIDITDFVPVVIDSIQFLEVDPSFNVINQDPKHVRDVEFFDGDSFQYDSIELNTAACTSSCTPPGGVQLILRGKNALDERIRNVFTITYTNDCNVQTFMTGDAIGWVVFNNFTPAREATCDAVKPTSSPTTEPTEETTSSPAAFPTTLQPTPNSRPIAEPTKAPTKAPTKGPTKAPTGKPSRTPMVDPPPLTHEPTAMSIDFAMEGLGLKSGKQFGKSGKQFVKSGKLLTKSGKDMFKSGKHLFKSFKPSSKSVKEPGESGKSSSKSGKYSKMSKKTTRLLEANAEDDAVFATYYSAARNELLEAMDLDRDTNDAAPHRPRTDWDGHDDGYRKRPTLSIDEDVDEVVSYDEDGVLRSHRRR